MSSLLNYNLMKRSISALEANDFEESLSFCLLDDNCTNFLVS